MARFSAEYQNIRRKNYWRSFYEYIKLMLNPTVGCSKKQ